MIGHFINNDGSISILYDDNMLLIKKDNKYFKMIIEGIVSQKWDVVSDLLRNCCNDLDTLFDDDE